MCSATGESAMNADSREPDGALVARVKRHDAEALALLYDRHAGRLMGLAQRILGDRGEAEEVLEEGFLYVWRAAAAFDPTRGPVLAWLLVATRSRSIDRLRSRRPGKSGVTVGLEEAPETASREDVEADAARREWETRCRAAIGGLPVDQRRALELAYFAGLQHPEIPERTATQPGTLTPGRTPGLIQASRSN